MAGMEEPLSGLEVHEKTAPHAQAFDNYVAPALYFIIGLESTMTSFFLNSYALK